MAGRILAPCCIFFEDVKRKISFMEPNLLYKIGRGEKKKEKEDGSR